MASLSEGFDAKDSDDLTIMTAETIKAIVLHLLADADDALDPKDAMHLASAFRQAAQAQSISTDRRRKVEAEFAARVTDAVDNVGKTSGMSAATLEKIKAEILGVQA